MAYRQNKYGDLIASPLANRIFAVNLIEIVTSEMNIACKRATSKLISDRTWSVAGLPKSVAARGVDRRRWMRFGCALANQVYQKRASRVFIAETRLSPEQPVN